ncbi:MAG: RHS repeat-associated core domain-containing protein [Rhabdochlamydiaceae bacterium]|nr:RHS repeat-associated core domain-containing protein [Candidatus Amphrikana amoebophyrae]
MRSFFMLLLCFTFSLLADENDTFGENWSARCQGPNTTEIKLKDGSSICTQEIVEVDENEYVIKDHIYHKNQRVQTLATSCNFTSNNLLLSLTRGFNSDLARTIKYDYDSDGNVMAMVYPNGVKIYFEYDANQVVGIFSSDNSIDYSLEYDDDGNIAWSRDNINEETIERVVDRNGKLIQERFPSGQTIHIAYDAKNEGISQFDLGQWGSIVYENSEDEFKVKRYSQMGKCLYEKRINDPTLTTDYPINLDAYGYLLNAKTEYDSLGNPVNGKVNILNELIEFNNIKCKYDLNGNLIEKKSDKGVIKYKYDALNRLIWVMNSQYEVSFTYDIFNRRMSKTVRSKKGQSSESYLYTDANEIGVIDGQGKLKALRIPGISIHPLVVSPVTIETDQGVFIPEYDVTCNLKKLTHVKSKKEITYQVDPFGSHLIGKTFTIPWVFQAKHFDQETGLVYFGHRYYDPELMRWTSLDPLGPVDGMNPYLFAGGNPVCHIDVDGRIFFFAIPITAGVAAMVKALLVGGGLAVAAKVTSDQVKKHKEQKQWEETVRLEEKNRQKKLEGKRQRDEEVRRKLEERRKRAKKPYAPDRSLPKDEHGEAIPDTDAPHTQLGKRQSKRTGEVYTQCREFDETGKKIRDIDFTDHGLPKNHSNPHQHKWEPNSTGGSLKRSSKAETL